MRAQTWIPAAFYRGGTSKGVFFHARHLPQDREVCSDILLRVLGSPDPNGRQLNGMGGGISSLSKAVIVAPPSREDADVDYTFVQLAVDKPVADWGGNCGNLSSAVGPFAVDEGLVDVEDGEVRLSIHQTNTAKIIHSRFRVREGAAEVAGDYAIDGVAGTGSRIQLDFLEPGGAVTGRLLPTGNVVDTIRLDDAGSFEVSLVDAAHPTAFVRAVDVGLTGAEPPETIDADVRLMDLLDRLRRNAGVLMGLAGTPDNVSLTAPRISAVAAPLTYRSLAGASFGPADCDIVTRTLSVERAHRVVPLTGSICLGVASRIEGTIPATLCSAPPVTHEIRIGHPSGTMTVGARVRYEGDWIAQAGTVNRTARCLMRGEVAVPPAAES